VNGESFGEIRQKAASVPDYQRLGIEATATSLWTMLIVHQRTWRDYLTRSKALLFGTRNFEISQYGGKISKVSTRDTTGELLFHCIDISI
jgi:hypothetical protein